MERWCERSNAISRSPPLDFSTWNGSTSCQRASNLGELVYSVPLSPAEEVNIAHKEWSNTSEEFSKIVTDYMEAFSEEGVAEKSELSQSTSSAQEQHSFGFNTGVTASGGYGPVTITSQLALTCRHPRRARNKCTQSQ